MAKAFQKLHTLPVEIVQQVGDKLLQGESPLAVANWLQQDLKVFTDMKTPTLKKNLERYRSVDLKDKVVSDILGANKGKNVAGLAKKLSALDEIIDMVMIQRNRVEKLMVTEANMKGLTMKTLSDEIRLFKELCAEMGKLQLEMGILARAPKKMTGTVSDPATGEVLNFSWSEENDQLMKTIEAGVVAITGGKEHAYTPDA